MKLIALLIAAAIIAPAATASTENALAISRIAATQDKLVFTTGPAAAGTLRLVELRPYQTYSSGLPVVWTGEVTDDRIEIPRLDGPRDRLYSKFQLIDPRTDRPVGSAHYVDDLSALQARSFPFLKPASIKGVQYPVMDDAISIGVKHSAENVLVNSLIDWANPSPEETWEVDEVKVPINMNYVRDMDERVKRMTDAGIDCVVILLHAISKTPDPKDPFVHPNTDPSLSPFPFSAFNTRDDRGLVYLRGAVEFLANRYTDPSAKHGWISGIIIGNEVQAHSIWHNIGRISLDDFVKDYGISVRLADLAARRYHSGLRVYVSMTQCWASPATSDPMLGFSGRDFVERFNAWSKTEGDYPWCVAYHPYPEDLFEPRFWNDRCTALSFNTPLITFKNIEVLPAYLKQDYMRCRGEVRRITLSEQGLHTPGGPDGETIQAAAFAAAYYKLSHMPEIDAFLYYQHTDKDEMGLRLGLCTFKKDEATGLKVPDHKKRIYEVYRLADTDQWEKAFEFAKPIIGIKDWREMLPSGKIESTPYPAPAVSIVDVPQKGPKAAGSEITGRGSELDKLRGYVTAQLRRNPSRDPRMVVIEFCQAYCECPAEPSHENVTNRVLKYLDAVDQAPRLSTPDPGLVSRGLALLNPARAYSGSQRVKARLARMMLPLWYAQLSHPEGYKLTRESAREILLEIRSMAGSGAFDGLTMGSASVDDWLDRMQARYGERVERLVSDLYLDFATAKPENCLLWRADSMQIEGRVAGSLVHYPKVGVPADASYEVVLPKPDAGGRLEMRFRTGILLQSKNGVRFSILADGKPIWATEQRELGPLRRVVDLRSLAGKKVRLTLRVDALGEATLDLSYWLQPRIVLLPDAH